MLTQIDLQYFKCFEKLKLPLRPLTLLSGTNASGKSSVLQSLVILHQTMREHEWSPRLMLNGEAVHLGSTGDVIDQVYGRKSCEIALLYEDSTWFRWEFEGESDDMSLKVVSVSVDDNEQSNPTELHHLLPSPHGDSEFAQRLRGLTYLTAERLGPRENYILDDLQRTPTVGSDGKYAISVLYSGSELPVLNGLKIEGVPPTRLPQVVARMARFFPGFALEIKPVDRTNTATLGVCISGGTDLHRPVHAGFGLTQILPIIVAALSASKDDLLLIENPEVHLHPAGQAKMGEFLAEVAAAGVQVILETHSDHILNGIRRAVKGKMLPPEDVALYFFRPRSNQADGDPQVQSIVLNDEGRLDDWPDGFFDQFDKDMNYFAGWS